MRTCSLKSKGAGSNQAIVLKPKLGVRKRHLKTPSRGQQAKASVAGVDMPFLKKGRASQVTWSCPLCKYEVHGTTKAIYPQKRHHVQTRHPLEKYENLIGKAQITVATPSADLPADARAWKCPLCPKALPALPKRETHLAVSRHRRDEHPEINTKDWKSAMVKVWARGVKKPKVARQSRTKAEKLRKKLWPGHDLVEVYCQCPKASFHRNPTQFWCVGCTAKLAGYGGGSRPRDEKLTCHQVKKLAQAKQRVRRAWAIIKDLKTVDGKPLKPRLHSWVRDLIEEGIEPNPGPDMLKCISLNTQGAPGAWHALQMMQEERIHVGLLQEISMSPKEIQSFQFFANKSGFRLHYQLGDANLRPGRGSAVLVQKHLHLHAKFLKTWFEHDCQPVAVNVEGVNFVSNYVAVSGSAPDTSQEILLWLQESLGQKPWIIMGDWNQVPDECCMSQILVEEGAQLLAVKDTCSRLLPTRWLGRRAIDFGITNYQPKICGSGASVHGSDHW